jgi:Rne/Rng family ribonuclease
MSKEMVISVNPHETRVAILEEGQLCEYYVEREKEFALVGSIYKGRVTRVLPGMQSAFVEIGLDSDAFLYVSDFMEEVEDLDTVVTTTEEKIQKVEDQGGHPFAENQAPASPTMEPVDVEPLASDEASNGGVAEHHAAEQESAQHIEPLPGESLSPVKPGETRIAPPSSFGGGHGRFEERGGRGGRDRFGRGRGRGRFGGRGRGRDDRHRSGGGGGRDLPQSKYAAPSYQQHDEQPSEPLADGHAPIILPGESISKYRDKPAAPAASSAAEGESNSARNAHESRAPEPRDYESHDEAAGRPHTEAPDQRAHSSFSSTAEGFEPLPGESISRWGRSDADHSGAVNAFSSPNSTISERREESEAGIHEDAADDDDAHDERFIARQEIHDGEEEHDEVDPEVIAAADPHEEDLAALQSNDHVIAELSAEQAASHAQNVAEMQVAHGDDAAEDELANFAEAEMADDEADAEAAHDEVTEDEEGDDESTEDEEGEDESTEAPGELDAEAEVRESLLAYDTGDGVAESIAAENSASDAQPQGEQQPWKASVRGDFRARMQHPNRRGGRDRGGRRNDRGRRPRHGQQGGHGHHHGRPGAPRRTQLISELLKQGQEIIVQIAKEPLGKKGARITSHVALPGRYLVYMPTLHHTGVSRKIASAEERARLRHLVNDAKGTAGGGFIVRTAASSAPPEDVRADVEFLTRTWSEIKARSEQRKAPSLLHRDLNLVERILRDFVNSDFGAVWVDSEEDYTKVVEFMGRFQPALVGRVKLYTKDTPIFEEFGIQQEIDKGLRPKVWLKSGGYIVINHTEALVAIDVNTGKFVGKGSNRLEDTIVRTNLEAVKEIVRQMRLRDLGGIIVIDFIDMEERRNREKVMAALEDALRADRAPSKVLRFNEFGLVAITRKRTKQALERTLCQPCPYCAGSGMVKSIPTLCYEIQAEAKKMAPEMDSGSITLRVNPEISKALKTRESQLIEELERWTKKSVIIQGDPSLHWEQYDIF